MTTVRSVVLVALAGTACGVDLGLEPCPPCTASVTASAAITLTSEQLNRATATVCRNLECATGRLEVDFGNPVGTLDGIGLGVPVQITVQGTAQIIMFVLPSSGDVFSSLTNGDVYHATITGTDGTMLLDVQGTAHYTDEQGSACFTLAECMAAQVTMM
jgi:hypothetical protein